MGGILISDYIKLNSLDLQVTSTRVQVNSHIDGEGSTLYSPKYYYEVNGNEYLCSSNSSSSVNPGTNNKTVYYDSNNPSKCMTEYSKSSNVFSLLFLLLPIIFIVVAIVNMRKISKRIKLINQLCVNGKLVKNLPYRLKNTGMSVNNRQILRPVVDYILPSGSIITLYGDPRHDGKSSDADGMVDLVIDENNPDNYFIDFEINRLSGNLSSDYYNNGQDNAIDQYSQQYNSNYNNSIQPNMQQDQQSTNNQNIIN